jgi:hypothetical protein
MTAVGQFAVEKLLSVSSDALAPKLSRTDAAGSLPARTGIVPHVDTEKRFYAFEWLRRHDGRVEEAE